MFYPNFELNGDGFMLIGVVTFIIIREDVEPNLKTAVVQVGGETDDIISQQVSMPLDLYELKTKELGSFKDQVMQFNGVLNDKNELLVLGVEALKIE
ncbi:hypothetical protein EQG49_13480 [Periweissella cryptocerci]|uniref:Uncharacterized protein n=1 Tax=Periweissella cryptocerci TaxID=2506420 RepID=A0A4P6YWX1_9LACO|nr:hypothetical protein [Periweissella cryptocerci]QBO37409.1 hypothetical protein EQG49_13480 [Periweissella cryptocerci]